MIKRDFLNHIEQRELFLIDKSVNSTKQLLAVPDVRKLNYLTIFVLPPSFHELERRLKVRSSDDQSLGKEQVIRRLARAAEEVIESINLYDVYIVNDEVVRAVDTINKLV